MRHEWSSGFRFGLILGVTAVTIIWFLSDVLR